MRLKISYKAIRACLHARARIFHTRARVTVLFGVGARMTMRAYLAVHSAESFAVSLAVTAALQVDCLPYSARTLAI